MLLVINWSRVQFPGRMLIRLKDFHYLFSLLVSLCSSASEGSFFPPRSLTKSDTVHIYDKDLCRILPLQYQKDVYKDGKLIHLCYLLINSLYHRLPSVKNLKDLCISTSAEGLIYSLRHEVKLKKNHFTVSPSSC